MTLSPTPNQEPAESKPAGVRSFLPNDLDPTVFDEGFLRQLERLGVLMKQPARGGLKGGRRSVKRGQSVEFADYRDYALGDDLRQLDWNVLRPPRAAVRQAVRRGGGRDDHVPPRREPVDGLRAAREAAVREAGDRRARVHRARRRGPRGAHGAHRPDRAAPERPPRLGPGVPAPRQPVGDPARGGPDRPPRVRAPRGRPAVRAGRRRAPVRPARPVVRARRPRARRDGLGADRAPRPVARRARPAARGRPQARRQRERRAAST